MIFGRYFFKYYIKWGVFFLIGIGILIYIDFIQVNIPIHIGKIVDVLTATGIRDTGTINKTIVEIIKIAAQIAVGRCIWRFCIFSTSRQIEFEIRNVMFAHACSLDAEFYHKNKVGGLMTYFINDLAAVRESFGPGILTLVDGIFLSTFAIIKMFTLNVNLSYIVVALLVCLLTIVILQSLIMKKRFKLRQDSFEKLSDFVNESFSGIQVVKAYLKETSELSLFNKKSADFKDKHISFIKVAVRVEILVSIITNVIALTILALGAFFIVEAIKVQGHLFTGGELTAYLSLFFELLWPLTAITRFLNINSQGQASAKRIRSFLDQKPKVKNNPQSIVNLDLSGTIEFKNLTFSYPDSPEQNVLSNINFKINPGEMVGIIGKTGSGKSCLMDLLLRIYNVNSNELFIDGIDIMDLSLQSVRQMVGYVPQDNFLFSDTISNNISFSLGGTSQEEIEKAAKLSDVHDNIKEFLEGYDTMLGERGVTISGGQKQRIAIARAIIKDPKILILDDSVSAVDTKTESDIIDNLFTIRKNKTTIIIAHRISTIKRMDKIILIDNHKVAGVGSYDQLLKDNNLFKDMVHRQELERIIEQ